MLILNLLIFQVSTIIKEKDSGLGISLEGTVRVVAGKEVQARHYIRAIAPNGPVARLGMYRVGDELLEVGIMLCILIDVAPNRLWKVSLRCYGKLNIVSK